MCSWGSQESNNDSHVLEPASHQVPVSVHWKCRNRFEQVEIYRQQLFGEM